MGNKKDLNKLHVVKPQQSFQELVSDASLNKLKPFIMNLMEDYKKEQIDNFQGIYERLTTLEKLVLEKTNTSDQEYADRVVETQDSFYGLVQVEAAELEDIVRLEVSTKAKDQEEFQGSSRMMITNLGSGKGIGKELEAQIVGMKKGESKQVAFGVEGGMIAKLTINRISRREA